MKYLKKLWRDFYLYPLVLFFLGVLLAWKNYSPGTFLSGWDTLHPEFNFSLAFRRMLNGVWRGDQGLGAVAMQSHMADLPRVIFLWLSSFVLPLSFLRYSYFFLMLIVGPLGIYFLTAYLLRFKKNRCPAGFVAGLVYLANLGTLQHFVVPLEMFAIQYGLLPWIILLTFKLLAGFRRKLLFLFSFLVFFASSQAHTATLFYAFLLNFILFLAFYCLLNSSRFKIIFRRATFLLVLTLLLNSYWLLPNIYAIKTNALNVRNSKVNQLFTPEAFLKGQKFGNLENATALKSFLFDWKLYYFEKKPPQFDQVLSVWKVHLAKPGVQSVGYLVFSLSLIGIMVALKRKEKEFLAFLPMFILSLLFLLNGSWPINFIFEKFSLLFPVLAEAMRFPFTKLSLIFMLTLSLYSAYGIWALISLSKRLKFARKIFPFIYSLLLLGYFLPAFAGQLIHPSMRINIPGEYFSLFSWFGKQDSNSRVAILPIHSLWNWVYYDWGYQGAGFLQFGIPQPILDRDYDRWSPSNEQYQREMAYAVYSQNPAILKSVLEKFQIKFVLFDESVLNVGGRNEATFKWAIPGLLKATGLVTKEEKFGSKITVYQIKTTNSLIEFYSQLPDVGPVFFGGPEDVSFAVFGPYKTSPNNYEFDSFRQGFSFDERFVQEVEKDKPIASFSAVVDSRLRLQIFKKDDFIGTREKIGDLWRYTSTNGPLTDSFSFLNLDHSRAYLLEINSRFISGFPLRVCLSNDFTRHCDLYLHLRPNENLTAERFLLPPVLDMAQSYTLNINNFAIKGQTSINELGEIRFWTVDYDALSGKNRMNSFFRENDDLQQDLSWQEKTPWLYQVTIHDDSFGVLAFFQANQSGWLGFEKKESFPFFKKIEKKVLINNWANGWQINQVSNSANDEKERSLYLFFWPQVLQATGFVLLLAGLLGIIFNKVDK